MSSCGAGDVGHRMWGAQRAPPPSTGVLMNGRTELWAAERGRNKQRGHGGEELLARGSVGGDGARRLESGLPYDFDRCRVTYYVKY